MNQDEILRQQAKTRERRFLNLMEQEFNYPPKIAQAILTEAQDCLLGRPTSLKPGQMRVILLPRAAPHGRALYQTATQEVTWTVNAGQEDQEVEKQHGMLALRQTRIQRLLGEAVEQGVVATQEDLAQRIGVNRMTLGRIERGAPEVAIGWYLLAKYAGRGLAVLLGAVTTIHLVFAIRYNVADQFMFMLLNHLPQIYTPLPIPFV